MNYTNLFDSIKAKAFRGKSSDIDSIMRTLDEGDFPISRAVDFYLGFVTNDEGLERLSHYLFSGTQIQRNYCALFFERRNDWELINKAYDDGCIDAIQAYSR
ncbi:MAG: hypothetical protein PQJ46_15265 [Spirochaetales bacterium]|nr:hypothetical protein [Spirochaetales bacterium]